MDQRAGEAARVLRQALVPVMAVADDDALVGALVAVLERHLPAFVGQRRGAHDLAIELDANRRARGRARSFPGSAASACCSGSLGSAPASDSRCSRSTSSRRRYARPGRRHGATSRRRRPPASTWSNAMPRCFSASAIAKPTGPAPMTSRRSVLDAVRRMSRPKEYAYEWANGLDPEMAAVHCGFAPRAKGNGATPMSGQRRSPIGPKMSQARSALIIQRQLPMARKKARAGASPARAEGRSVSTSRRPRSANTSSRCRRSFPAR